MLPTVSLSQFTNLSVVLEACSQHITEEKWRCHSSGTTLQRYVFPFHKATCVPDDTSNGTDNNLMDFLICCVINISLASFSTSFFAIHGEDRSSGRPGGHHGPWSPYAHALGVCFWIRASSRGVSALLRVSEEESSEEWGRQKRQFIGIAL